MLVFSARNSWSPNLKRVKFSLCFRDLNLLWTSRRLWVRETKKHITVFNFFKQSQKSDRNDRTCFHHFWTNANVDSDHTAQTSPVVLLHSLCHLLSMTLSQVLPCSKHFFQVMQVHLSEAARLQLVSSGFAVLLSCLLHNILHKASHLESLWLGCSSQDLEGADKNQVQQTRLVFLDSKRFQKPSETHCII